jgi:hypothetical protein
MLSNVDVFLELNRIIRAYDSSELESFKISQDLGESHKLIAKCSILESVQRGFLKKLASALCLPTLKLSLAKEISFFKDIVEILEVLCNEEIDVGDKKVRPIQTIYRYFPEISAIILGICTRLFNNDLEEYDDDEFIEKNIKEEKRNEMIDRVIAFYPKFFILLIQNKSEEDIKKLQELLNNKTSHTFKKSDEKNSFKEVVLDSSEKNPQSFNHYFTLLDLYKGNTMLEEETQKKENKKSYKKNISLNLCLSYILLHTYSGRYIFLL